ncbi:hypothetical protein TIFTF001_003705 [Ficus carica]|uniref:Uncharacterized protein n=1 Tax=Ficus carica TaxID=3494 RepID=A0AA87ZEN7_FICCA|nr:hypothetical protein TIFTF001_003705 [Ficus carica]
MAGETGLLVDGHPIESKTLFTADECMNVREDPNLSSSWLTFKISLSYRIRSDTSTAYHDVCIHNSREEFRYEFDRVLSSDEDEREAVVAEILSSLEIPILSVCRSSGNIGDGDHTLQWKELDESYCEDMDRLNDVVSRISDVAARVAGCAVAAERSLAAMMVIIEKRCVFPQQEFERLVSSFGVGYTIEDEDEDDSDLNLAVEQSLLESEELVLPADASAVKKLEKLRYEGRIDHHDHDQDQDHDDERTCVIYARKR